MKNTRRFPLNPLKRKISQEDFCSNVGESMHQEKKKRKHHKELAKTVGVWLCYFLVDRNSR